MKSLEPLIKELEKSIAFYSQQVLKLGSNDADEYDSIFTDFESISEKKIGEYSLEDLCNCRYRLDYLSDCLESCLVHYDNMIKTKLNQGEYKVLEKSIQRTKIRGK